MAEAGKRQADFLEHLEELRQGIIRCLIALMLGAAFAWTYRNQLFLLVLLPVRSAMGPQDTIISTHPAEMFALFINLSLAAGVVLALPAVLGEVWVFVSPGLTSGERRALTIALPLCGVLFVSGVVFCYSVLPIAMRFLKYFASTVGVPWLLRPKEVLSLVMWMCVGLGLVFQLPLVMGMLSRLGVVPAGWWVGKRRHASIVVLIIAAVITPTTDVVNLSIVAVPILVLFELGVLGAKWGERKRAAEQA